MCLATIAGALSGAAAELSAKHPFLQSHCIDCHDTDIKKGGFDLTQLSADLRDPGAFNRWVQIFDRVESGEMPPKTEERPPADQLKQFTAELGASLVRTDADRIAREGRVPPRRLTRFEYERSLHDLLGVDVPLLNLLPEDTRGDGFDTVAIGQQVSHYLLEKYLGAIDVALDAAFVRATEPERTEVIELGWPQLKQLSTRGREPGPRTAQQDAVAWSTTVAFHGRIPSTRVRDSSWYRVTLRASAVNPPANGEVWSSVRSGYCVAAAPALFWVGSFAATTEEREHTFEAWIDAGHRLEVRPLDAALKRARYGTNIPTAEAGRDGIPGVAIKSVRLEKIKHGLSPAATRERLFGGLNISKPSPRPDGAPATKARRKNTRPTGTGDIEIATANPSVELAGLVRSFAARAFRAPVTDADVAPYLGLGRAELEVGAGLVEALRAAYRGILASPRFLYLEAAAGPLPDYALASRLSYFLWSTVPDDELRAVAERGELRQPARLHAQVDRMLAHPKASAFVQNFTDQWLNLAEIDFTVPDAKLYPEYDEILKHAMVEETRAFFAELVKENLSVSHLVDSSFGLMNSRLARHYGVRWPGGQGVQRVTFRPEDHRGGLITHASVLKVTANGTSTSPVIRGVWMLERILGQNVPPVPADVPALEPDIRGAKTIREQLDKHRNTASCAVCHVKIDPPGFALENYDVIGGWRDHYRVAKEGGKGGQQGPAVDASYAMADGRKFENVAQFKRILLASPEQLARAFASQLVTYATGAPISFADRAAIEEIVAATRGSKHGVRALVQGVVGSPLFLHK